MVPGTLFTALLVSVILPVSFAQSNTPDASTWVTNGNVNSIVSNGSTVYLGGAFTHVGPAVPYGVALSTTDTTVLPNMAYAKPNGAVRAVASDGSGGWFIGGDFTYVGDSARNRLARINSDGTVNAWNPNVGNNSVYAIAVSGGTVYIGGNFTSVAGLARNRIAALNANATGTTASPYLASWNPNVSSTSSYVYAIAVSGGTVYIGGNFTTVAGTPRNRIAALYDTAAVAAGSRYLASWNPNVTSTQVYAIAVSGGTVYVGGGFSTVAGSTRNRIAALYDTAAVAAGSPYLATWNPNISGGSVNAISVSGSKVYVGGSFTSIASTPRNRIAALNDTATVAAGSVLLTAWYPDADGAVSSLLVSGTTVYAGGDFENIGGLARPRIAALDATANTNNATSWNPKSGGSVLALANYGGTLYAGGSFTIIGGEVRNRLAAIDASTGQANDWNPNADGTVYAILLSGGVLYAGGSFTTMGDSARSRIAAIHPVSGTVTAWNPNASGGDVVCLAASGDTIYAGGNFTTIGGKTRNKLASLSASHDTAFSWNPNVNGKVNAIAVSGGKVYFGGQFFGTNSVNGNTTRNYLAAVNESNGIVTSWNPNPITSVEVFAVAVYNGRVYVAGNFATIGDSSRKCFAELNANTGKSTAWNPGVDNTVSALAFSGSMVFAVRSFTSAGGYSRTNLAGLYLNVNTSNATPWNPIPDGHIYAVAVSNDKVYIGGAFNKVNGESRGKFASFPITSVAWGGSTGGDWSNAANWAPGIVPTSSLDVSVTMGRPSLNQDYTLPSGKTLTLSGTGSLTVAPGKTLTLAGTADFGSRPVTFKSDATGTASLGPVTGTLSNAGAVTVERYIPAARKWRFLTAPLMGSSNNSIYRNWQNNGTVSGATGIDIWGAGGSATPSTGANGLQTGPAASMRSYGASGWSDVTDTKSTLLFTSATNNAFSVFVKGPFKNGNTPVSEGAAAVATTLSATGTPITGTHTKTLSANPTAGQYFLVGNPYASSVNPNLLSSDNLANTFWMWDATTTGGSGAGSYVAYNRSPGTYNVISGGFANSPSQTQIQSGQAFFARATTAGTPATITFEESDKTGGQAGGMFGPQQVPDDYGTLRLTLRAEDTSAQSKDLDGAVAFFYVNANAGVDAMDGAKMMNTSENLLFRREGRSLTFEHRPNVETRDTLFLRMSNLLKTAYRLKAEGSKLGKGLELFLSDRLTGKQTILQPEGESSYGFTVTDDSLSTGDRFTVLIAKPTTQTVSPDGPSVGEGLRLHPNPARGMLRVSLDVSGAGPLTMQVFDATGAEVIRRNMGAATSGRVDIDVSRLKAGLYTLLVTDALGTKTMGRFVRE
jgi:hypothetical protein